MDLQRAFYDLRFAYEFRSSKGDSFQTFFEKLIGLAYRGDFMACRPWGRAGDRKNDGFLKSERRLFQVYAPNEIEQSKAIAKIQEDFDGAKLHWGTHFDKWVFAHNATDGLPPHVHKVILNFETENPRITLEPWGLEEFRVIFRKLTVDDVQSWFGFVPSDETKSDLGFSDLQVVLESIADGSMPTQTPVKEVPMGKIEADPPRECRPITT